MNTMQEHPSPAQVGRDLPSRWHTGGDLPPGFFRSLDGHWMNVRRGGYYVPAPRGLLRGDLRRQAIVLVFGRRTGLLSFEATVVRELLEARQRTAPYSDVVRAVQPWARGRPEAFIRRAADDTALIRILVRVDER